MDKVMPDKELILKQWRRGVITDLEALNALKDAGATETELNTCGLPLERIAIKQEFQIRAEVLRVELRDRLAALDHLAEIEDDEMRTQASDDINMEVAELFG